MTTMTKMKIQDTTMVEKGNPGVGARLRFSLLSQKGAPLQTDKPDLALPSLLRLDPFQKWQRQVQLDRSLW